MITRKSRAKKAKAMEKLEEENDDLRREVYDLGLLQSRMIAEVNALQRQLTFFQETVTRMMLQLATGEDQP
jgi:cell division protein FtsB